MPKHALFSLLLPVLFALGCAEETNEGTITGTILVDGEPAETGSIAYIPVDGNTGTGGGVVENGKYTARAPAGKMKVQIQVNKVVGQRQAYDAPGSRVTPVMEQILPPKYNTQTTLEIDVQPGENVKNYELSTKG
jgi:hypothetical protein